MKTTTQSVNRLQVLRVCTQNKREKKGWHVILPEKCNPMPWVCTIFHKQFSLHIIIITDTLDICLYHATSVQAFWDTTLYFKRQSKQWISRPIYEATTQVFREELTDHVLQRRLDTTVIFRDPSSRVQVPRLPANIAPILKPNKEDVIATHTSRYKGSTEE